MALARLLPQAEMLVVTTPGAGRAEGRDARRRHGAPLVPEGGRRRREHERVRRARRHRATRSSARAAAQRLAAQIGAPLVGAIPIEPAVSEGGDTGTPGRARRTPTRPPARALHAIARPDRRRAAAAGRDGRLHRAHLRARAAEARVTPRSTRSAVVRRGRRAVRRERARRIPTSCSTRVMRYGGLAAGDAALEIGAGTGKATRGFVARGLDVTRSSRARAWPNNSAARTRTWSRRHSRIGRRAGAVPARVRRAVVALGRRCGPRRARAADALGPGGTIALFWNLPRPFDGALGDEIQAVYATHGPDVDTLTTQWPLDETIGEFDSSGCFDAVTKHSVDWVHQYSTDDYITLMGTHSNHRILNAPARGRLQRGVGEVIRAPRRSGRRDLPDRRVPRAQATRLSRRVTRRS